MGDGERKKRKTGREEKRKEKEDLKWIQLDAVGMRLE